MKLDATIVFAPAFVTVPVRISLPLIVLKSDPAPSAIAAPVLFSISRFVTRTRLEFNVDVPI